MILRVAKPGERGGEWESDLKKTAGQQAPTPAKASKGPDGKPRSLIGFEMRLAFRNADKEGFKGLSALAGRMSSESRGAGSYSRLDGLGQSVAFFDLGDET